jgi:hypothetical protein
MEDYTEIFYTIYEKNISSIQCKKRLRWSNSNEIVTRDLPNKTDENYLLELGVRYPAVKMAYRSYMFISNS